MHMIVDTDSVGTAYFLSLQCSKLGPNFDRTFGRPILTLGGHCQICSDILICMHVYTCMFVEQMCKLNQVEC